MATARTPPSASSRAAPASSSRGTQSHSRLPSGVRTKSARWPMAKLGSTPTPHRSGSFSSIRVWCSAANSSYESQS
jgi:hypothetical protein